MRGHNSGVIALLLTVFLGGFLFAIYPLVSGLVLTRETRQVSEAFIRRVETSAQTDTPSAETTAQASIEPEGPAEMDDSPVLYTELLAAIRAYNEQIYREGQAGLTDAWAYQKPSFELAEYGIDDGVIGVLSIPSIDLEMPIYLGATYEHMAAGAAHLSQTSLPIGGVNTNCVIAGHRGWKGAAYFLYLDRVQPGDTVTVTNLWETLTYTVREIRVIEPNDIADILIQPGRELLTLLTCHPYASGGRYRLVLYCERDEAAQ